jgi:uncharacterized integral membrane protein (TIGR00698 family)
MAAARDYSWAEYLDCMEGGDIYVGQPKTPPAPAKDSLLWGLFLVAAIVVTSIYISELAIWPLTLSNGKHPVEPVMLAIIIGMIVSNSWALPKQLSTGIKFSVRQLLPIGIIFLGARLNFLAIVKVGASSVLLGVLETVIALALLIYLSKRFNLSPKLGVLLGVGTAICGGTAIVATAPVIEAEEKDVVFSVATVTLLGLIAMFLLPAIGTLMALTERAFGIWAGLAIHQTPQVVAAGFAYGKDAGETATIVKLARICLLAPVVALLGWYYKRKAIQEGTSTSHKVKYWQLVPLFVLGFLGMALLRTLEFFPDLTFHWTGAGAALFGTGNHQVTLTKAFEEISKYCIIMSMAAVGLETKFSSLKKTGPKPFLASLFAAVVIAVVMLALIQFFNI